MQVHTPLKTAAFAHPTRNVGALGVEPGMVVADFGSGSGAYVLAIAERLEGTGRIYAIDIQKELLRRIANEARRRDFKNVEVIWTDLETPYASKIADTTLDLVLISNILFQVPDKQALFLEARRILKPTGRVAVIDWQDSFDGLGPVEEEVVTKEDTLALAKERGFILVKEFPAGAHHYGLILRPTGRVQ